MKKQLISFFYAALATMLSGWLDVAKSPVMKTACLQKRKYLNRIILMLLITGYCSCKKQHSSPPPNNNELKATVVVSPTNTIIINAAGPKAKMGCLGIWGGGTAIEGTSETNAAVYITTVYTANLQCVTSPGTYNFACEYRKNIADQNMPIYLNNGINRGSITFTAITDSYMEGYFNAVCRCVSSGCVFGVDSVTVSGTFKGDRIGF